MIQLIQAKKNRIYKYYKVNKQELYYNIQINLV